MPGRLRTASRPFRTWISLALYSWSVAVSTLVLVMISSAISFLPLLDIFSIDWIVVDFFQNDISVRRFMAALDSSER